jgi:hypothetical protein
VTRRPELEGGEQLQRVLPGVDGIEGPTGELDGLPQPPEVPRWLERLDDWLGGQLAKPAPRWLLWWERLVDRTPVWAQPIVLMLPMVGLTVLSVFVHFRVKGWFR